MTHGSLFSGIGGFDLAAEWMGWENIFHCEWNPFGQKVLKYYWPNAISYENICTTDFTIHRGKVDIITGGFPCQPYSLAGKRLGKDDERHLWPEMLRTIREVQPRWVVGENVFGLVNWSGGLVFHEVQADLEAQGYEVQPYILPAVSVNAPHRRDRIWFMPTQRTLMPIDAEETMVIGNRSIRQNGKEFGANLETLASRGLLPTPKAQDCRHALRDRGKSNLGEEISDMNYQITGKTSHLSPQFVMEMMGFPSDWTLLPFLNGDKNQLKLEETQ